MTELETLTAEQDTDRETDRDHEAGALLAEERARKGKLPQINALTWEQVYVEGKRLPVTFDTLGGRGKRRKPTATTEDESVYAPIERYEKGDDHDDPGEKEPPTVEDARVGDLVTDGHGFNIWKVTTNPNQLERCVYCGARLLAPDNTSVCEFGTDMGQCYHGWNAAGPARSGPRSCRCNGCRVAREGRRKRGGQPRQCGSAECEKAATREKNARAARKRNDRHRFLAVEVIRQDPTLTNREIGDRLGIPYVRVLEAREPYPLNT